MHRQDRDNDLNELIVREVRDYAIYLLDGGGHIQTWNQGAELINGHTPAEVHGRHFEFLYTDEDRALGKPRLELALAASRGRFDEEGWRVRKDGSRYWANEVITAVHGESRELRGFLKIVRDLSQRKRVEDELRESEERHRLLVENVRDYAVFMLDPNGNVTTWNRAPSACSATRRRRSSAATARPSSPPRMSPPGSTTRSWRRR